MAHSETHYPTKETAMTDTQKLAVAALAAVGAHTVYKRVKSETRLAAVRIRNHRNK